MEKMGGARYASKDSKLSKADLSARVCAALARFAPVVSAEEEALAKIESMPDGRDKTLALFRHAMNHPRPVGAERLAKRAPASESESLAKIEHMPPGNDKTLTLLRRAMAFPKRVR
jgi:hypothetical protein